MRASVILLTSLLVSTGYASSATHILPKQDLVPQTKTAYVDINDCTKPIKSTPYVIVLGNGGANMKLSCPPERPVMYGWQQEVGFFGIVAVQSGGGNSRIVCCPVAHKWVPSELS